MSYCGILDLGIYLSNRGCLGQCLNFVVLEKADSSIQHRATEGIDKWWKEEGNGEDNPSRPMFSGLVHFNSNQWPVTSQACSPILLLPTASALSPLLFFYFFLFLVLHIFLVSHLFSQSLPMLYSLLPLGCLNLNTPTINIFWLHWFSGSLVR